VRRVAPNADTGGTSGAAEGGIGGSKLGVALACGIPARRGAARGPQREALLPYCRAVAERRRSLGGRLRGQLGEQNSLGIAALFDFVPEPGSVSFGGTAYCTIW
jgi:hypothetical protein